MKNMIDRVRLVNPEYWWYALGVLTAFVVGWWVTS